MHKHSRCALFGGVGQLDSRYIHAHVHFDKYAELQFRQFSAPQKNDNEVQPSPHNCSPYFSLTTLKFHVLDPTTIDFPILSYINNFFTNSFLIPGVINKLARLPSFLATLNLTFPFLPPTSYAHIVKDAYVGSTIPVCPR